MQLRSFPLAATLVVLWLSGAAAAVLTSPVFGCRAPADATRAAALRAKKDAAGFATFSQPLVASRACLELAKGVVVGVDENRAPLSCVRLTGDLECYWVPGAAVDLYPGQKGGGGRGGGGGRRR